MFLNFLFILFFVFSLFIISKAFGKNNLDLNHDQNEMIRCSKCQTYVVMSTAKKINEEWFCTRKGCA
jgi:formylmethanofuran dehydrogenase subunit E